MNLQTNESKSQRLTRFAIELIREHYEPTDEGKFKEICRDIARYFDEIHDDKLASFIRAQIGDEPVWIPQ